MSRDTSLVAPDRPKIRRSIPIVGGIVLLPHLHRNRRLSGSGIVAKMTVGEFVDAGLHFLLHQAAPLGPMGEQMLKIAPPVHFIPPDFSIAGVQLIGNQGDDLAEQERPREISPTFQHISASVGRMQERSSKVSVISEKM